MLDFGEKVYKRILDFCVKRGLEAAFSEYPVFAADSRQASAAEILPRLAKNFQSPGFSMGLYVHVPFCQSRCLFCRFYSEEADSGDDVVGEYLDALEKQLETYASKIDFSKVNLRNLYLGGGTPTLLSEEQLCRLFGIIRRHFRFDAKKIQVSCEATPQSITENKVRRLRSLGVNRVSLGVESFDEKVLKRVGRNQSAADVFRAAGIIRRAGIRYLSIDLLIGLPGETIRTYRKTIRETLRLKPEAVEIFNFFLPGIMEAVPVRAVGISTDEIMDKFQEELSYKYRVYLKAVTLDLVKRGMQIRKVINANQRWVLNFRPCLGLGPSAINVFPNMKFIAARGVGDYINQFKYGGNRKIFAIRRLTEDDRRRNFVITSIAVARWVDKNKYFKLFHSRFERDFRRELGYLKKAGIVSETKNKFVWRLKDAGVGYKSYFPHVLKFWYHPKYIRKFINANNLKTI